MVYGIFKKGHCGEIGIHAALKMLWGQLHVGSSPTSGTKNRVSAKGGSRRMTVATLSRGTKNIFFSRNKLNYTTETIIFCNIFQGILKKLMLKLQNLYK